VKSGRRVVSLFAGLTVVGAGAFAAGIAGPEAARAWQAYLVNFVFWTGLAAGAVLLSAILTLTGARWAGPIQQLSEAFSGFLPVSCLLFAGLWFGKNVFFPYLATAPPARRLWLDAPFLFSRDGTALALLAAAAVSLSAACRRDRRAEGTRSAVATIYAVLYAVALSLLGFDWVMSLDAHWVSTLFGAYYFVGSFYSGLAAVALLAGLCATDLCIEGRRCQDLGTLLLGFAFTMGYLFFVQFLVIWYGNVPAETQYLLLRLRTTPWAQLCRVVLAVGFCLPVLVLLFRSAKARPPILAAVGCVALAGMWLERFVLVAPSLSPPGRPPLGPYELLITAGFCGLVGLSVIVFLRRLRPSSRTEP
jgi:hypothetical protein